MTYDASTEDRQYRIFGKEVSTKGKNIGGGTDTGFASRSALGCA